MMVLIGSQALHMSEAHELAPHPRDVDIIARLDNFNTWCKDNRPYIKACYPVNEKKYIVRHERDGKVTMCEFEIAWEGSSGSELVDYVSNWPGHSYHCGYIGNSNVQATVIVPSLEVLLALKTSHRYLKNSPFFMKTMKDIHGLRALGVRIPESLKDWLKKREKETYAYKHPNLKQSKQGFFDASVKYTYDHDTIHKAIALTDAPAYESYKSDKAEVFCDKEKFWAIPDFMRLYGVYEEACVLALERSQVPFKGQVTPRQSFLMALEKVCTSITSGFFREYAWENYFKVLELYETQGEREYVNLFEAGVANGIVKLKETTNEQPA